MKILQAYELGNRTRESRMYNVSVMTLSAEVIST